MKLQVLFLVLATLFISSVQSSAEQGSRFPIQPNAVWRINFEYSCMDEGFSHQEGDVEYKYFIDGDTLIGSKSYYKLYQSGIIFLETPLEFNNKYMGAIRDSSDHFYYVEGSKISERLLYNFAAKTGELICSESDGTEYIVGGIDTLEDGRMKYYIDVMTVNCGSANCLIEGIGWLGGLLEGNACYAHPGIRGSYLLCYSENGIPVYMTENSRCGEDLTCNIDFTSIKETRFKTAPVITVLSGGFIDICFPDELSNLFAIEIFTIEGRRIFRLTSDLPGTINAGNLGQGTFLIRMSNDQMVYSSKFMIQ